ncbi:DUF916 domain-containing protein [Microbacterium sp. 2FI]|uniref:DUF916 domain-containing protein n=1 Tax=Microbacterium sp. 2FI TaxID=2502193 RepID=UPI002016A9DE|nr:DUF916 domain-containing protein [Microbacterium sp. 2FI]
MPHLTSRPGGVLRALLAVVLAAAFGSTALPAAADTADDSEIRWSVTPADESGPDGRSAVEHDIDPGDSVSDHFAVRNVSAEEVTFRLAAADGFYTRTGRFDMLPADQESVDSGTWISIPDDVTVAAGETVVVPFDITVPETAEPGDHAAGITASILSVQSGDDGASVGVESRIGFRVLTRVTGEITPAAAVEDVVSTYALSWNPLRPGEMTVTFDVVNTGNTRLIAEGVVEAGTGSVAFPVEGEITQELLPGDTRTMTAVVDGVWPLFVVPVKVILDPVVVTMDGETSTLTPVVAEVVTWAVPWPQLIVVLGIVLVIGAVVWGRIRSRRRLDTLLADAREEGRRAAERSEETV